MLPVLELVAEEMEGRIAVATTAVRPKTQPHSRSRDARHRATNKDTNNRLLRDDRIARDLEFQIPVARPDDPIELGERKMGPARRHAFRRCEGGEILSGLRESISKTRKKPRTSRTLMIPSSRRFGGSLHAVLSRKKIRAERIARTLKRTEGATRQKAFSLGLSLDSRA